MRYFDQGRFFRVIPGFIAQFGVHNKFQVHDVWRKMFIPDDPPVEKNLRGTLAYAKSDPGTRATEVFINLKDNPDLDEQRFVPFGKVVEGMDVVDQFYAGYGAVCYARKGNTWTPGVWKRKPTSIWCQGFQNSIM